jgi:hypothetical protein
LGKPISMMGKNGIASLFFPIPGLCFFSTGRFDLATDKELTRKELKNAICGRDSSCQLLSNQAAVRKPYVFPKLETLSAMKYQL